MPNSTQQSDIREFLRIQHPQARVESPTTGRNERRMMGVDELESLVFQLYGRIACDQTIPLSTCGYR